jgi:hypothetical protein
MFIVTSKWLLSNLTKTPHGHIITVDQAKIIGERFPLVAGWIDRAVGKTISEDDKQRFELRLTKKQAKRYGDTLDSFCA